MYTLIRKPLRPKKMFWVVLGLFIISVLTLSYPIAEVFAGRWKLNQQIPLFTLGNLNLFGLELQIGTIPLRFYAVCMLVGIVAGYALALYLSRWHLIASSVIDRLFIGLVIIGLLGARAFYVLFNLSAYRVNPLSALYIHEGGLAIFGMLFACLLYLRIYCARFRFNFYEFLDFLAPSVLVGQIFGRFGNFFNYEGYGGPTTAFWKMFVPETADFYQDGRAEFFHPTWLYEVLLNTFLLLLILFNYESLTKKRSGMVFVVYAIGYGIIRFFLEFYRIDALVWDLPESLQFGFAGLNFDSIFVSQVAAIVLILAGIFTYWQRSKVLYIKKTMSEFNLR